MKYTTIVALFAMTLFLACGTANKNQRPGDGFISIFDGKTLNGWEGDPRYWSADSGTILGKVTPETLLKTNTFLIWRGGTPADFEFKADYRITDSGNSGINYRSVQLEGIPYALKGYQADLDGQNHYVGSNYEERGRTTLASRGEVTVIPPGDADTVGQYAKLSKHNRWSTVQVTGSLGNTDSLGSVVKRNDWNEYHLIVRGNHLQHFINGVLMSDVTDNDSMNRKMSGLLGVQVHVGPPMNIRFKNIRLKTL